MSKVTLHHGDCLEIMKSIPDKSVDLVLTDPPYNIKKAEWDKFKTKESYVSWCGEWITECQRVLKDNGSFYFFHNDMTQISMIMEWIRQNTAFIFKSMLTIDKLDNTYIKDLYGSQEHFRNYLNLAEYCLFYTFQDETGLSKIYASKACFSGIKKYLDAELEKSGYSETTVRKVLNNDMASHYFGFSKREKSQFSLPTKQQYLKLQQTGAFSREYEDLRREYEDLRREYEDLRYTFNGKTGTKNVWAYSFRNAKKIKHPTTKPVDMLVNIIEHSSHEGQTVLDPFMGSGSTGVACVNTNRRFIGIEKDAEYFKIAEKRINEATGVVV